MKPFLGLGLILGVFYGHATAQQKFTRNQAEAERGLSLGTEVSAFDYGMILVTEGHYRQAFRWYEELRQASPNEDTWRFGQAWVLFAAGDTARAGALATELITTTQDSRVAARAHYLAAAVFLMTGDPDGARQELELSYGLYESLQLNGGMNNCEGLYQLLDGTNRAEIVILPPMDEDES